MEMEFVRVVDISAFVTKGNARYGEILVVAQQLT